MVVLRSDFIKCVVLGDDSVGKTSLLVNYATNRFPTTHVPSVFDNYAGTLEMSGKKYHLQLLDTLEEDKDQENSTHILPGADIVVVCYSVVQPTSFRNVEEKWAPHLKSCLGDVPIILVGTQTDLRMDCSVQFNLRQNGQKSISSSEGFQMARKIGASRFLESSPELEKKMKRVLNKAIGTVLHPRDGFSDALSCVIL
ncbi:rho-related GTP-binding protein RhoJ-like [Saccostrea echinata]|uniref:rho-related GTP-binding protein RhoJ-like n=1 Tax=Saccostrea echinata TaxID=191078 RepID=UPI002A8274E9|nr:rho-related GTP-binding protein RhoJ-like [Saccostrea echinata]XP_061174314.1 rho-related GTP-binding protein RhoJ-like [Saccostrea echinata]